MIAFGVISHSPRQTMAWLHRKYNVPYSSFGVAHDGFKKVKPVMMFKSFSSFRRGLPKLSGSQCENVRCLVFCSPLEFGRAKGMYGLDVSPKLPVHEMNPSSKFRRIWDKARPRPVRFRNRDYSKELVERVREGSLLNPLMSFIYTLPSSTHQKPIKLLAATSIVSGSSQSKIYAALDHFNRTSGFTISPKAIKTLIEILESPAAYSYRKAFVDLRTRNLQDVVKDHDIDSYEMNYMMSVTRDDNEYKKILN
jgi:hypothetical protein